MNIEKLSIMPSHIKVEDGYAYEQKYIGKLFEINGKIIYFKEKSYEEFPNIIFKTIFDILESNKEFIERFDETVINFQNDLDNLNNRIAIIEQNLTKDKPITRDEFNEKLKVFVDTISSFSEKINELYKIKDNLILKSDLNSEIDNKLTDVYSNFEKVSKQLVQSAVSDGLKDSKRDQSGKMKLTTLMMLKELGYNPNEIKSLAEIGLI